MTKCNPPHNETGFANQERQSVKIYEPPVIVHLGELVKGYGACQSGGAPDGSPHCRIGTAAVGFKCETGGNPRP